ncbi:DUF3379 family protein [Alteromonas ponticola]|uniref:DUF3379 domain-containing protein n=1 Tax=Alteromonas ponticola TaxID=2720613 RepID=A0ABX1QZ20_9ALTE|nr:DUF3379 family protein [Alteromonas ponticola]NMH59480.1 DUF3379 domain-containing protein [Alteromonas ponticola]
MDELEFRRRIYADPHTTDEAVIAAAEADTNKQAFWNEIKAFNAKLEKAVDIDVPDDLVHRLIWQQGVRQYKHEKRKKRRLFAFAASIALVAGISFTLWDQWLYADLQKQLLTHVSHATEEISYSTKPAGLGKVNAKLASFGGHFEQEIGEVEVANYCYLGAVKALHLILSTAQGSLSVFILPENERRAVAEQFSDGNFKGSLLTMDNRNVVVIGATNADLSSLESKIKQSLKFTV